MKKTLKLTETELTRMVNEIINESYPRKERERKDTNFRSSQFEPYPKEEEIMNKLFGPYKNDVPVNVIQYLRKNLRRNVSRLGYVYKTEINEVGGYDDNFTGTKHTISNVETLNRAMSAITDGLVNLSKVVRELMVDEQERSQLEKLSVRMTDDAIQMNEIVSKLYDKYKSRFKGNQIGMSGGGQFSLNEKK